MNMIITICCFIIVISVVFLFKNYNTYYQRCKIGDAISKYMDHEINSGLSWSEFSSKKKIYDRVEDYHKTLFRIWDWGYKRILPKEFFMLIKQYMR